MLETTKIKMKNSKYKKQLFLLIGEIDLGQHRLG